MLILVNLVNLGHHGHVVLVADLGGTEIFRKTVGAYDALSELRQRHVLLTAGQGILSNEALIDVLEGLEADFQSVIHLFLPNHLLALQMRVVLAERG